MLDLFTAESGSRELPRDAGENWRIHATGPDLGFRPGFLPGDVLPPE